MSTRSVNARSTGIVRAQFEASTYKVPSGTKRLTCSLDLAVVFIESFRSLATEAERTHDSDLLIRCAESVKSLFDAIDFSREH